MLKARISSHKLLLGRFIARYVPPTTLSTLVRSAIFSQSNVVCRAVYLVSYLDTHAPRKTIVSQAVLYILPERAYRKEVVLSDP